MLLQLLHLEDLIVLIDCISQARRCHWYSADRKHMTLLLHIIALSHAVSRNIYHCGKGQKKSRCPIYLVPVALNSCGAVIHRIGQIRHQFLRPDPLQAVRRFPVSRKLPPKGRWD